MSTNTCNVKVFDAEVDKGWLKSQNWWFDQSFPHSFSIFDLDGFYEETYFKQDHVSPQIVRRYVTHVLEYGRKVLGREVRSVLELGCGGGWFTEEFLKRGIDIIAAEGTHAGYNRALKRGVPASVLIRHDLRLPLTLDRTFDMVVCTEVAEHVECPFASQLVHNITRHGKVAWFSFEEPDTDEPHYHHCNEQPDKFWVNLFKFYGFEASRLPEEVTRACEARGDYVFYSRDLQPAEALPLAESNVTPSATLGAAADRKTPKATLKDRIKLFVPPILWQAVRGLRRAE
jgi:cyclopropane fatty-acyl-phospholipid synthase-like methyltransferase